jgi:hypothetical protein
MTWRESSGVEACSYDRGVSAKREKQRTLCFSDLVLFGSTVMYHCLRECFFNVANNEERQKRKKKEEKHLPIISLIAT